MSFNLCKNLGADMILGNVIATNITCKTITVSNPDDPTNPADLTVDTLTADTGNFDIINVNILNISNPTDPTIPTD